MQGRIMPLSGIKARMVFFQSSPIKRCMLSFLFIVTLVLLVRVIYIAQEKEQSNVDELEKLRMRILHLSKKYIHSVANGNQYSGLSDTKKTAVVIKNILQRLQKLEKRMQRVSSFHRESLTDALISVMKLRETLQGRRRGKMIILFFSLFGVALSGTIPKKEYCVPFNSTTGQPSPCWPTPERWDELSNKLTGSLTSLKVSDYQSCEAQGTDATRISAAGKGVCMQYHDCSKAFCNKDGEWNIPAYSVEVRNVADIQATIAFAQKYNIAVTIKTSGHSYAGSSTGKGTLLIWMHKFQKYGNIIKGYTNCNKLYDSVIKLGGGQTWKEAYDAVGRDYYITGGGGLTVSTSGGWLMGGGLSAIARNLGLGIDNVIDFEIVLADGQHVRVDACTKPDLFWALRGGGGGTFGVITSVHYKLHPSTKFVSLTLHVRDVEQWPHPVEKMNSFHDFWVRKSPHLDRRWGGYWTLNLLYLYFQGNMADAKTTFLNDLEKWRNELPGGWEKYAIVYLASKEYDSFYDWRVTVPTDKTGSKEFNIANRLVPRDLVLKDPEGMKEMLNWLAHNGWDTFNYFLGGAVTDVGVDDTAVQPAYRNALWQIETFKDPMIKKLREIIPDSGSGLNHASKKEPNWEEALFGKHVPRLKQLKKKYDPENRFNCWHCIGYVGEQPASGGVSNTLSILLVIVGCLFTLVNCLGIF